MYKDWEYFFEEAEHLAKTLKINYSKSTTSYNKGEYSASFDSQTDAYKNFIQQYEQNGVVGFDFRNWTKLGSVEGKEKALRYLLNQTASYLYAYYMQNNPQPISKRWKYFLAKKDENISNIHFDGKIGRNVYDYFRVLIGEIDLNSVNQNTFKGEIQYLKKDIFDNETPKELYFQLKTNAKKEWIENNNRYKAENYKHEYTKINTFTFDEENIPEIAIYEDSFNEKKSTPSIPKQNIEDLVKIENLGNNFGYVKVGFNKDNFIKTKIVVGRQKKLIFPNNDQRNSYFLVVELDEIIASHNEKNFSSSKDYPTNENGNNINDRNYSGDKNAQAKVLSVAQNLLPEIIISTSATASGTPIISIDGIVVSGNNRIMSLKIAKNDFPDNYDAYKKTLFQELEYGGYNISMAEVFGKFNAPVLVRLDADFQTYETTELNRYNQGRSKTERSIDMTIRVQDKLENSNTCTTQLINLISELEIVSELYNSPDYVKRFKKILLDCNLIGENDISNLFTENSLSENGKNFYDQLLLAMVLDRNSLEISQNNGIKSFIKNIVNAIIPLIKNESFEKGNLLKEVNNAVLIQNAMLNGKYSDIATYTTEKTIFGDESEFKTEKALIIAALLGDKANTFKNTLIKYNNSVEQNEGNSLFGDPMPTDEIFKLTFEPLVNPKLLKAISILKNEVENEQVITETLPGPKEQLILRIEKIEKTLKYAENKAEIESYLAKLKQTLKYI